MKRLMLVINPAAGKGGYKYNFGEAMHLLGRSGYQISLFFTAKSGDATNMVKQYAEQYDAVACIGGDGTLSEVMAGMMQISSPPPLGYIPMGTANDVATTLNLPKNDILGAVKIIIQGSEHPYDVGGFGKEQYFAYIAAFGAFTEASYSTPQSQKRSLGHMAYLLQGAATLTKLEAYHASVEYDGGIIEDDFLYGSMSNSTSMAGILRLPEQLVSLGDGNSELMLVRSPESIEGLADIGAKLLAQRFDSKYISIIHTRRAKFRFDREVAWTRDGEDGGKKQEIELYNYPHAINFIF